MSDDKDTASLSMSTALVRFSTACRPTCSICFSPRPGDPGGYFRFTNQNLGGIFKLTFKADPSGANLRVPRQADRQNLRTLLLSGLQEPVRFGREATHCREHVRGSNAILCGW